MNKHLVCSEHVPQIEEQQKKWSSNSTDGSSLQPRFDASFVILHNTAQNAAEERPHARPSAIARQSREAWKCQEGFANSWQEI